MSNTYPNYTPKIVMITGATGGFGQAFAMRFAAAGSKLILVGRNQEKLDALKDKLGGGGHIHLSCYDITDKAAMTEAFENLPEEFRDIDLLINNAGGAFGLEPAHEAKIEDWEEMIEINNKSLVILTRLALGGMAGRKSGHIINIGSIAGNWVYPGGNVYNACKAFTKQFSLAIRADLIGTNIRVSNIEPGIVDTEFSLKRFRGYKSKAAAVYANTKPLHAEDIAETVFWTACLPPHVNINTMEIMPTMQTFGPLVVERFDS